MLQAYKYYCDFLIIQQSFVNTLIVLKYDFVIIIHFKQI